MVVYLIMFPTGIVYMAGLVRRGPRPDAASERIESGLSSGPFENAARTASDS